MLRWDSSEVGRRATYLAKKAGCSCGSLQHFVATRTYAVAVIFCLLCSKLRRSGTVPGKDHNDVVDGSWEERQLTNSRRGIRHVYCLALLSSTLALLREQGMQVRAGSSRVVCVETHPTCVERRSRWL